MINESNKENRITLTARQSAANDVLIYSALLLANDQIVESQLQPKKLSELPLSDEDMDILKGNIDKLLGHKHNLERAVKAWLGYLTEPEAKPFIEFCKRVK